MSRGVRIGFALLGGLLLSSSADAHIVSVRLGDFFTGVLHPYTDPIDWFVWIGVALLGAASGRDRARWLILAVPAGLTTGLWLSGFRGPHAASPIADLLPLVLVGGLLAAGWRLSTILLVGVAFALMVLRGYANAAGLGVGSDVGLYGAGLAAAGYVAATLLAAVALSATANSIGSLWRRTAIRVLGSWMAAAGLMLMALALRNPDPAVAYRRIANRSSPTAPVAAPPQARER